MMNKLMCKERTPLVSVIIPVYNNEVYLEACMRSVVCQTYKNLEIIVVNDGSTDHSLAIIEKYKSFDPRIICINRKNEGPFLARKVGLDSATGKYVQYLDSDDTLLNDAIERLVIKAEETNADIVAARFYFCYPNREPELSANLCFDELSGLDYYREILVEHAYWSVWSNFQKRSLSLDSSIRIVPEITYGEDTILMTQLILNANKVVALLEPILNYNKYSTTITAQMNDSKYRQLRASQLWIENYLEEKKLELSYSKELAIRHIRVTFSSIYWNQLCNTKRDMKRVIKDLSRYPDLISLLSWSEQKLLSYYRISSLVGRLKLIYYKKKGKI